MEEENGKREGLEKERSNLRSECWETGQRLAHKREQLDRLKRQAEAYRELIARNTVKKGYLTGHAEMRKKCNFLV